MYKYPVFILYQILNQTHLYNIAEDFLKTFKTVWI